MTKNIDLINKVFLGICLTSWILFFTFIWDVDNYWVAVIWFLTLIAITAGYVLTKPSSIKVMTEEEPEQSIEYIDEPADWQECYEIAEKDELDREADKIIKEVSEACCEIGKGDYDAPRI